MIEEKPALNLALELLVDYQKRAYAAEREFGQLRKTVETLRLALTVIAQWERPDTAPNDEPWSEKTAREALERCNLSR